MERSADEIILASLLGKHKKEYQKIYKETHGRSTLEVHELRTLLIIESCTLIEGLANLYLSLKCDAELFSTLEKATVIEKWTTIPALLIEGYHLDKSRSTYKHLVELVKLRNSIIHPKPIVIVGGILKHKGAHSKRSNNEHKAILSYVRLPIRLVENLIKYDKETMRFQVESIKRLINGKR